MRHASFILFGLILIAICLFKWNRVGILGEPLPLDDPPPDIFGDSAQYIALVRHFRGESTITRLEAPYTYRPLIPFFASLLPFDPLTSIDIINVLSLLIALYYLSQTLGHLGLSPFRQLLGLELFVLSFPTFYYSAIGYIDPGAIAALSAGLYFTLRGRRWAFVIALALGLAAKETVIIIIPVWLVYRWLKGERVGLFGLGLVTLAAFELAAIRLASPGGGGYLWQPMAVLWAENADRVSTWGSIGLTFGVQGLGALWFVAGAMRGRCRLSAETGALLVGFGLSILVTIYALVSAYADGRPMWLSYPFSVPLALLGMGKYQSTDKRFRKIPETGPG